MGKENANKSFISEVKDELRNPEQRGRLKEAGYALTSMAGGVTGLFGLASERWVVFGLGTGIQAITLGRLVVGDIVKSRRQSVTDKLSLEDGNFEKIK